MKIDRCCCTCDRCMREHYNDGHVSCKCKIDGHYIGYMEAFEHSCRRYALAKEYKPGGKWYKGD